MEVKIIVLLLDKIILMKILHKLILRIQAVVGIVLGGVVVTVMNIVDVVTLSVEYVFLDHIVTTEDGCLEVVKYIFKFSYKII
tara:strand:+ start:31 stop:279 length:249 start_codon:yes stop_codon:yes gene_type:complete